jgi:hypothetical protein
LYAQRRDANEKQIIEFLVSLGGYAVQHDRMTGYDNTFYYREREFTVEIKDGSLAPSRRQLTPREAKTKADIERVGGTYWVIESVADCATMLGVPTPLEQTQLM